MTPRFGSPEVLVARPARGEPDPRREAELAAATADLDAVQRRIVARKREIAGCWGNATTADRLLAVDRLLRDGNLSGAQVADVGALQSGVRSAFHAVRAERKRAGAVDVASAHLARLEAEVVRQETARDRFIGAAGLTEELWRTSETFVLPAQMARQGPFRELLAFEALLEQRVLHLQRKPARPPAEPLSTDEPEEPELPEAIPAIHIEPATTTSRRPFQRLMQLLHGPAAAAGV
ncbi:MAG: hypothetical protein Q8O67_07905 [Deltaproteobacteria bacterium]|nr:hypothetical protein [Deltaproteobacteria bacterium]